MDLKQVYKIYDSIFRKIRYQQFDIFLCGGASWKGHQSYRDQIREKLNRSFSDSMNILYPEELFMDMLNRKDYDLLTMEKVLAQNCDVILIVPESPGSFAELGAFVNNKETAQKVIVLQQQKYKRQRSFITQGPVMYMASHYKNSVIYFDNDLNKIEDNIKKSLRVKFGKVSSPGWSLPFKDTDQLTGIVCFEILLLYFYERIAVDVLWDYMRESYNAAVKGQKNETVEDVLVKASFTYLYKHGYIRKRKGEYELTQAGVNRAEAILNTLPSHHHNADQMNGIRLQILRDQLSVS